MFKNLKVEQIPALLNRLPLASGIFSALLGLVVIAGWHTHNITLLKLFPSFEAMRYNTALGFFLSGMGLISAHFDLKRHAKICAATVAAMGLLTLSEYIFGVNIGIDQLLFKDAVSGSFPGRMAPSTALGFAFTGFSLLLIYSPFWQRQRSIILGLFGSIVFSLGFTALFGYVTGISTFIAWSEFIAMAAHASAGFVAVGTGIIAFVWRDREAGEAGSLLWLPGMVGVCVITGTLMLWRVAEAQEISHIDRTVSSKTDIVKDHIQDQTTARVLALVRMANRWGTKGRPARAEWESDANLYLEHYTGLSSIRWINPSLKTQWSVSKKEDLFGLDGVIGHESDMYRALIDLGTKREAVILRSSPAAGGKRALTASVPISHDGKGFEGFISGTFNANELFDSVLLHEVKDDYSVAVYNGDDELYRHSGKTFEENSRWARELSVGLYGADWRVRVWPESGFLNSLKSPLPNVVLAAGLSASFLLALLVHFVQTAQKRAVAAETANFALGVEVAERKRAEAEVQRHARELEHEMAERRRAEVEVAKKTSELERSNSELEHFAYVASHDLQEPLRIINGYLQLLARRYKGKLDDSAEEFIDFAVEGGKRLQRMINDLLTYSKVGRISDFTHVDCSDLFDRTVPNLRTSIEESGAVITRGELPRVLAVETQLEHLFQNLISNAIKYRRGDTAPSVHVSAKQKGDEWLFACSDNGIGIDPKHSERVFVMFERLHGRDKYSGTGIGLALCKKVINNHRGSIWVESKPGEGSTFYFTIPLHKV
jgi:signal transduction histidine kinase